MLGINCFFFKLLCKICFCLICEVSWQVMQLNKFKNMRVWLMQCRITNCDVNYQKIKYRQSCYKIYFGKIYFNLFFLIWHHFRLFSALMHINAFCITNKCLKIHSFFPLCRHINLIIIYLKKKKISFFFTWRSFNWKLIAVGKKLSWLLKSSTMKKLY